MKDISLIAQLLEIAVKILAGREGVEDPISDEMIAKFADLILSMNATIHQESTKLENTKQEYINKNDGLSKGIISARLSGKIKSNQIEDPLNLNGKEVKDLVKKLIDIYRKKNPEQAVLNEWTRETLTNFLKTGLQIYKNSNQMTVKEAIEKSAPTLTSLLTNAMLESGALYYLNEGDLSKDPLHIVIQKGLQNIARKNLTLTPPQKIMAEVAIPQVSLKLANAVQTYLPAWMTDHKLPYAPFFVAGASFLYAKRNEILQGINDCTEIFDAIHGSSYNEVEEENNTPKP